MFPAFNLKLKPNTGEKKDWEQINLILKLDKVEKNLVMNRNSLVFGNGGVCERMCECTHGGGLVLQQLQAAPALLQLLVDVQLLLLRPLVALTEVCELRLCVLIL